MNKQQIYDYIDSQKDSMMLLWENIVRLESPSADLQGVKEVAAHLDTYLTAMGLNTRKYIFESAGPSLAAFTPSRSLPPVVLMAHMDTVHKKGSFGDKLFVRDGEYVYGPGVYDCKGGIVIAFLVLKALAYAGYDKRQIRLILSGDEEVAHSLSNQKGCEVYAEEAAGAAAAFNCESGLLNGDIVTQRKGGAVVKVTVHGVSAHAGNNPRAGASAIVEAARKILEIEAHSDPDGTSFNCGQITGGTGSNVVADRCEFMLGIRFLSNEEYEKALQFLEELLSRSSDPRIHSEFQVQAVFKAMEPTEKTDALMKVYSDACEELGLDRPGSVLSGGCSDSAYISMQKIPVLCATGVRGSDNHSPKERAVEASILERAKILTTAILNLPDDF